MTACVGGDGFKDIKRLPPDQLIEEVARKGDRAPVSNETVRREVAKDREIDPDGRAEGTPAEEARLNLRVGRHAADEQLVDAAAVHVDDLVAQGPPLDVIADRGQALRAGSGPRRYRTVRSPRAPARRRGVRIHRSASCRPRAMSRPRAARACRWICHARSAPSPAMASSRSAAVTRP